MFADNRVWLCILTIILSVTVSCNRESFWRPFLHPEPVTLNYYNLIKNSSLGRCAKTCSTLYKWDQIYHQGEDCYCLAPVYLSGAKVIGTVTTNSSIWIRYQDQIICSKKGYSIFYKQKYCLKLNIEQKSWYASESNCLKDNGHLMSIYTQQDVTNYRIVLQNVQTIHVGAHRSLDGKQFSWITGGLVNQSLWAGSEGSNLGEKCSSASTDLNENPLKDIKCVLDDFYCCQILMK